MQILLVEDEPGLAGPLMALLRRERYEANWANSLTEARSILATHDPDLIALDVMLPESETGGFELAKELRQNNYRGNVLFLTARDAVEDRVMGLDIGGDDYLVKPFSLDEFLARVRALLRRSSSVRTTLFERGSLRFDFTGRAVFWNGKMVSLSEKEFALLERLCLQPDRIFPVEELLEKLFPDADSGHKILRVYIHRLREKIDPKIVTTLSGGYSLGV